MKWLQKHFIVSIFVVLIMLFYDKIAFAAVSTNIRPPEITNVFEYTNKTEAKITGTPRGRLLSSVTVRISDEGRGTVGVYADMLCHVPTRKMMVWLYLEQWDNTIGDWNTVDYQHFEWLAEDYPDEDLTMAMVSYNVPRQERGQEYRIRGMFGAFELDSNYQESWTMNTANLYLE